MADEAPAQGTPAPAATAAPTETPVIAAPAEKPRVSVEDLPPEALKERLTRAEESARKKLLAELGIDDPEAAKAALEAARKAEEEKKSIADRLAETSTKLGETTSEAKRYREITAEFAARQMLGLTEDQRKAVTELAGEDPAAQLKTITVLQATWLKDAAAAEAAKPKPAPAPSGTAPKPGAPEQSQVTPTNHQETYASLAKTNPFAAAAYASEHMREVFPETS